MKSKLFVRPSDLIDFHVYAVSSPDSGSVVSISGKPYPEETVKQGGFVQEDMLFRFSKPSYEQVSKYRQLSLVFDKGADSTVVNPVRMRELLLMYHLKEWNVTDEEDKPIALSFDPDESLSVQSLNTVKSLDFTVIDVLMTMYEKKINII